MNKKLPLTIIALLFIIQVANAQNRIKNGTSGFRMPAGLTATDYLPKTIVFKVKPEYRTACKTTSVEIEKLNSVFNRIGASAVAKIFPAKSAPAQNRNAIGQKLVDLSTIYKIEFTSDIKLEKAINSIIATGMVEYAEPFYVPHTCFTPNDPSTGLQYFLNKINAYLAWDITHGDTTVVIGIVDTG